MKSIIFDLGAVMVDWNPQAIAQQFTDNNSLQNDIVEQLFHHNNWIEFDNGLINKTQLIEKTAELLPLSIKQVTQLMANAKTSLAEKTDCKNLLQLAKDQGIKAYCLSNLSHEWYDYLQQRHQFFKLFDGIVISAQEQIGKPNIDIFQRLIRRYQIDTNQCLFIDDRADNTKAARSLGIQTVTFSHSPNDLQIIKNYILNTYS